MMMGSKSTAQAPADPPNADPGPDISAFPVPTLQTIYKEYFDFVWSSARHLGATGDAIDDVVQDVFIVIHHKLATLQRPEALRSWIYGIVRRTVSDYRRSRRTRDAAGVRLGAELKSSRRPNRRLSTWLRGAPSWSCSRASWQSSTRRNERSSSWWRYSK
jgi:hypothetical protein